MRCPHWSSSDEGIENFDRGSNVQYWFDVRAWIAQDVLTFMCGARGKQFWALSRQQHQCGIAQNGSYRSEVIRVLRDESGDADGGCKLPFSDVSVGETKSFTSPSPSKSSSFCHRELGSSQLCCLSHTFSHIFIARLQKQSLVTHYFPDPVDAHSVS